MKIGVDGRSLEEERTGIGRYLGNLMREWALEGRGHTFHLYHLNREPQDAHLAARHISRVRLSIEAPYERAPFYPELDREPVDVFFSPLYDLPRCLHVPAAITVHDMVYEAYPEAFTDLQLDYLRATSALSLPRASRIITDSAFARGEIVRYFPGVDGKIAVIPLACDPGFFEKQDREAAGRLLEEAYGLTRPFFFYAGSISKKRHIPGLLEAFARFEAAHPGYRLFLAGRDMLLEGPALAELLARVNGGRANPAVLYAPYVPEEALLALYGCAEAFVYLSEYEGFGMPPLEAMACGTPVITTALTSLPEVVGDAALTVDPHDGEAVLRALETVAFDGPARGSLVEKGARRCRAFSWKDTAARTLDVLEDAARRR